ncbi:DUF4214 domain-containing protein [Noviherbaspirillum sp. ST9]|uniref:DUF4214 domain-containing protein n=1 Tax=Noviherbaspirillum sp. ST9 TaxID=3401606 RepID=UPI003B58606F
MDLTTGTYRASTYDHFYTLNLRQGSNVFIEVSGDNGTSAIYDSNMQYVSRTTTGTPLFLEAGTYNVHAKYSSPTNGVMNVYIPSQLAFDSLRDLSSGSYQASSYVNFYALNIKSGGNLFLIASGDSARAAVFDRDLNFVTYPGSGPTYLDAGNYIVLTSFNGYRNGVLNASIPESIRTEDTNLPPLLTGHDTFYGSDGPDLVQGLTGNDRFTGRSDYSKPDVFFGGPGNDVATYQGRYSEYKVTFSDGLRDYRKPDGALVKGTVVSDSSSGRDGTDYLHDVERLQFADKSLAFDVDGVAGQAYRLYQASFNRPPDKGGLGFQINALDSGLTLQQVAQNFIDSPEFKTKYGAALSNGSFVNQLYANVLHRAPDSDGYAYQVNALENGLSRSQLLINFSESPENYKATLVGIQNGIEYTPVS